MTKKKQNYNLIIYTIIAFIVIIAYSTILVYTKISEGEERWKIIIQSGFNFAAMILAILLFLLANKDKN